MIGPIIVVCVVLILAIFIGLPYYQAHQRRAELARRENEEKERARQGDSNAKEQKK